MAYEITLLTTMAISILFALSLNFISGFCGQISLGHAAFLGAGAYVSAMMTKAGIPFLISLPAAALVAGLFGFAIGLTSLRVRHDFLAITTMGPRTRIRLRTRATRTGTTNPTLSTTT